MFKSRLIKSNHRIQKKNGVGAYGAPVFAPEYNATVLGTKICTNSIEYKLYFISMVKTQCENALRKHTVKIHSKNTQ
jgi:hypothetical protein